MISFIIKRIFKSLLLSMAIAIVFTSQTFALDQVKTEIDGHTVRLDYVDENRNIIRHPTLGYATILRTLDKNGRALTDFYYDEEGNAVPTPSGAYGVTRIYDDLEKVSEYIFLDRNGAPILLKEGFAILKRTYNEEGKADTDTYYDLEGNPVALYRGQYGFRRVYKDRKVTNTLYIDQNGRDMFFLDLFLQRRPWLVAVSMIMLLLTSICLGRRGRLALFTCYVLFIIYMTLCVRERSEPHSNLELFWSYRKMLESGTLSRQVGYNIALFVPVGFLTVLLFSKKGWMISLLLSVCIETLQYFTGTGLCEFDDVFSNTLGGMIGVVMAEVAVICIPKLKDRWVRLGR